MCVLLTSIYLGLRNNVSVISITVIIIIIIQ